MLRIGAEHLPHGDMPPVPNVKLATRCEDWCKSLRPDSATISLEALAATNASIGLVVYAGGVDVGNTVHLERNGADS